MATICLMLLGQGGSQLWPFFAGCCAALAIHSNVFTLGLVGIFLAVYFSLSFLYNAERVVVFRQMVGLAIGAGVVTVCGALYYWFSIGTLNVLGVTLSTIIRLNKAGAGTWRTAGAGWLITEHQVFVPVWLSACCALVFGVRRRSFAVTLICCYGIATTAFYFVHQFVLKSDTLQLFYYFSYAAPAIFLMMAILLQFVWENARISSGLFVATILASVFIPWFLSPHAKGMSAAASFSLFAVFAVLAFFVIGWSSLGHRQFSRPFLAIAAAILIALSFDFGFAKYRSMIRAVGDADTSENDVYRVALQFMKTVPPVHTLPGGILFWYTSRSSSAINSIQSTYLWRYSMLQNPSGGSAGMPTLTDSEAARLKTVAYLGLIAESAAEIQSGLETLSLHRINFRELQQRQLASGRYRIFWKLLKLESTNATEADLQSRN
jgi:hypothetical protein